ncbi:Maf family protein [Peptostreptococcaceae bacterium OttesenSCG-928-C18]|nr:Maf family protein [Peptostreptococcaceae bacterium OttesenSCG-928-C18]
MNNILNFIGVYNVCNSLKIDKKYPIILGSSSPRRIELLKYIINDFKIIKPIVNENSILKESIYKYKNLNFNKKSFLACSDIALEKAKNIYKNNKDFIIISADTIVVTEDRILGKPKGKKDAYETLISLLGKFHYVATAICIYINECNYDLFYSVTGVKFTEQNHFTVKYIKEYVDSEEPLDKAGSYGLQQVVAYLVDSVHGDYYNTVGFPVVEIRRRLYENFN